MRVVEAPPSIDEVYAFWTGLTDKQKIDVFTFDDDIINAVRVNYETLCDADHAVRSLGLQSLRLVPQLSKGFVYCFFRSKLLDSASPKTLMFKQVCDDFVLASNFLDNVSKVCPDFLDPKMKYGRRCREPQKKAKWGELTKTMSQNWEVFEVMLALLLEQKLWALCRAHKNSTLLCEHANSADQKAAELAASEAAECKKKKKKRKKKKSKRSASTTFSSGVAGFSNHNSDGSIGHSRSASQSTPDDWAGACIRDVDDEEEEQSDYVPAKKAEEAGRAEAEEESLKVCAERLRAAEKEEEERWQPHERWVEKAKCVAEEAEKRRIEENCEETHRCAREEERRQQEERAPAAGAGRDAELPSYVVGGRKPTKRGKKSKAKIEQMHLEREREQKREREVRKEMEVERERRREMEVERERRREMEVEKERREKEKKEEVQKRRLEEVDERRIRGECEREDKQRKDEETMRKKEKEDEETQRPKEQLGAEEKKRKLITDEEEKEQKVAERRCVREEERKRALEGNTHKQHESAQLQEGNTRDGCLSNQQGAHDKSNGITVDELNDNNNKCVNIGQKKKWADASRNKKWRTKHANFDTLAARVIVLKTTEPIADSQQSAEEQNEKDPQNSLVNKQLELDRNGGASGVDDMIVGPVTQSKSRWWEIEEEDEDFFRVPASPQASRVEIGYSVLQPCSNAAEKPAQPKGAPRSNTHDDHNGQGTSLHEPVHAEHHELGCKSATNGSGASWWQHSESAKKRESWRKDEGMKKRECWRKDEWINELLHGEERHMLAQNADTSGLEASQSAEQRVTLVLRADKWRLETPRQSHEQRVTTAKSRDEWRPETSQRRFEQRGTRATSADKRPLEVLGQPSEQSGKATANNADQWRSEASGKFSGKWHSETAHSSTEQRNASANDIEKRGGSDGPEIPAEQGGKAANSADQWHSEALWRCSEWQNVSSNVWWGYPKGRNTWSVKEWKNWNASYGETEGEHAETGTTTAPLRNRSSKESVRSESKESMSAWSKRKLSSKAPVLAVAEQAPEIAAPVATSAWTTPLVASGNSPLSKLTSPYVPHTRTAPPSQSTAGKSVTKLSAFSGPQAQPAPVPSLVAKSPSKSSPSSSPQSRAVPLPYAPTTKGHHKLPFVASSLSHSLESEAKAISKVGFSAQSLSHVAHASASAPKSPWASQHHHSAAALCAPSCNAQRSSNPGSRTVGSKAPADASSRPSTALTTPPVRVNAWHNRSAALVLAGINATAGASSTSKHTPQSDIVITRDHPKHPAPSSFVTPPPTPRASTNDAVVPVLANDKEFPTLSAVTATKSSTPAIGKKPTWRQLRDLPCSSTAFTEHAVTPVSHTTAHVHEGGAALTPGSHTTANAHECNAVVATHSATASPREQHVPRDHQSTSSVVSSSTHNEQDVHILPQMPNYPAPVPQAMPHPECAKASGSLTPALPTAEHCSDAGEWCDAAPNVPAPLGQEPERQQRRRVKREYPSASRQISLKGPITNRLREDSCLAVEPMGELDLDSLSQTLRLGKRKNNRVGYKVTQNPQVVQQIASIATCRALRLQPDSRGNVHVDPSELIARIQGLAKVSIFDKEGTFA